MDSQNEVRAPDDTITERLIEYPDVNQDFIDGNIDEELRQVLQTSIETANKENNQRYYENKYNAKIEFLKLQDEENRRLSELKRIRNKELRIEKRECEFRPVLKRLTRLKLNNPNILVLIKLIEKVIQDDIHIDYYFYEDFHKNLNQEEFEIVEKYILPYESDEE